MFICVVFRCRKIISLHYDLNIIDCFRFQTRHAFIVAHAENGGAPCPRDIASLTDQRPCNTEIPCAVPKGGKFMNFHIFLSTLSYLNLPSFMLISTFLCDFPVVFHPGVVWFFTQKLCEPFSRFQIFGQSWLILHPLSSNFSSQSSIFKIATTWWESSATVRPSAEVGCRPDVSSSWHSRRMGERPVLSACTRHSPAKDVGLVFFYFTNDRGSFQSLFVHWALVPFRASCALSLFLRSYGDTVCGICDLLISSCHLFVLFWE